MGFSGKYELHEILGKGGFGTVYRATDTTLHRIVALKFLHPALAADSDSVERFRREARIIAQLDHPGIVTVYEVGEADGRFFIAMKYLSGGSLAARLSGGPLPLETAVAILRQVCAALQTAHAQGLVHRDLKPANLLFDAAGQAVISDFGLARAFAVTGSASSSIGVVGTPFYRAPELWRGDTPAGPPADVYSLGCVFAEMLTGISPFSGDTPERVLTRHLIDGPNFGPVWPPPGSPPDLARVIARALERDPARRFSDAAALAGALGDLRPEEALSRDEAASPRRSPQPVLPSPESPAKSEDLARLYEDGLSAFYLEHWEAARDYFAALVKQQPDYRDAAGRLDQVQQQLDLQQRYRAATDLLKRSDWAAALAVLEPLNLAAPNYHNITQDIVYARQQLLYAEADRLSQAKNWQGVIDTFAQIARLSAKFSDPRNLLATARKQLAEQERQDRLAAQYRDALQAIGEKRWADAHSLLNQILRTDRSYRDAESLSRKVKAEMRPRPPSWQRKVQAWFSAHRRTAILIGVGGLVVILVVLTGPEWVPPLQAATSTGPAGMVLIPAGEFKMGCDPCAPDERPVHAVRLRAFWMDRYEVTNARYAQCVAAGVCSVPELRSGDNSDYYKNEQFADYPVLYASWDNAGAYCQWRGGRLPTEAEWEKAARGGLEGQLYPWGNAEPVCTPGALNGARFQDCGESGAAPASVGSFLPNGYGLYDMAGNAQEWVQDHYYGSYYASSPVENPSNLSGYFRVIRGGGWNQDASAIRVAYRGLESPALKYNSAGFRCVIGTR